MAKEASVSFINDKKPQQNKKGIHKEVWRLAGPALVEQTLMTLVRMFDMIQVGTLGAWAIASVGFANQPMFLFMAVFMGLGIGTTALVARLIGAEESDENISEVVLQSMMITIIASIVLAVLGFIFAPWVARVMGAQSDTLQPATMYFKILMAGLVFFALSMVLSAAMRGAGDTKTPMYANLIGNLVNITGNWLLIHGIWIFPRWGVAGAAAATSVSRVVTCIIIIAVLFSGKHQLHLKFTNGIHFNWQIIKRVFNIGVPTAMERLVLSLGQVVFVMLVASFGTTVMAAHQVGLQIERLALMPAMAFQMASTTLVGQSLGTQDKDLAEFSGWESLRIGMYFLLALTVVFLFGADYIVMLFTDDPDVIAQGSRVLKIIAFVHPAVATQFVLSGGLRGAGDTKYAFYTTLIGIWTVRIGVGYILAVQFGMGLTGAWIAMALDIYVRAALILVRYRSGIWKHIKI